MSQVHRVLILNKPFKVYGLTIFQLALLAIALVLAIWVACFLIPNQWKMGNLPTGFVVGLLIFCAALVFSQAIQMKPVVWWFNMISYRAKLVPVLFMPHSEPATIYPDPTIIEASSKADRPYVTFED